MPFKPMCVPLTVKLSPISLSDVHLTSMETPAEESESFLPSKALRIPVGISAAAEILARPFTSDFTSHESHSSEGYLRPCGTYSGEFPLIRRALMCFLKPDTNFQYTQREPECLEAKKCKASQTQEVSAFTPLYFLGTK